MRKAIFLWLAFVWTVGLIAQPNYLQEALPEHNARMQWWRDARFGLFIHWGLYAVPAGAWQGKDYYGEWIMEEAKIPVKTYETFASQFNPTRFDADAWVQMAKRAGMKYIVITSKHHDGFSLWNSATSDYDVADRTPFRRDPLRELADACQRHGLRLCFYHSIMDWHHPQAKGETFAQYREQFLKPQLHELLTQYGPLGVLWFDGEWIEEWTEEQGRDLYQFVRSRQPNILINNRVGKGRNGMQGMTQGNAVGDFGTPEQEILGEKSAVDWESCMTMNTHWGYNRADKNFKKSADLLWNLVDCAAKGGNYLLNVGPTAEGLFPAESVDILAKMGNWMDKHGKAIHGSRAWVHHAEGPNIRYTQGTDGTVYVFAKAAAFDGQRRLLLQKAIPAVGATVLRLTDGTKIGWKPTREGTVFTLPDLPAVDDIVVLSMQAKPAVLADAPTIGEGKSVVVFAKQTNLALHPANARQTLRYTLDGSTPTVKSPRYGRPLPLMHSADIRVRAYEKGKVPSETVQARWVSALAGIRLQPDPAPQYTAYGPATLLDGQHGTVDFQKGNWLGFNGKDVEAILDFGQPKAIQRVMATCLRRQSSWIFWPTALEWATSDDGIHWTVRTTESLPVADPAAADERRTFAQPLSVTTRYIRLRATSIGKCPTWHSGAGSDSWLFIDEVSVE